MFLWEGAGERRGRKGRNGGCCFGFLCVFCTCGGEGRGGGGSQSLFWDGKDGTKRTGVCVFFGGEEGGMDGGRRKEGTKGMEMCFFLG